MGIPEWKPIPRHIKTDDSDTQVAFGVFGLLLAAVLFVFAVLILLALITGLLR